MTIAEGVATVVIVAAGRGERFGNGVKILEIAAGRPLLAWSLLAVEAASTVSDVVVVAGPHSLEAITGLVVRMGLGKPVSVVVGGETRRASVALGIAATPDSSSVVLVHDAARPLAPPDLFDACTAAALEHGAAISATPVADTLKHVESGKIVRTVLRDQLWGAQTPQAFRRNLLVSASERTSHLTHAFTDEASLLEALGEPVWIVPGSPSNIKVTRRADLDVADALLRHRYGETPGTEWP